MAEVYKHGTYGESVESNYPAEVAISTLPVYIGSFPVQRLNAAGAKDYDYAQHINEPILLSSAKQINSLGIYSDDWKNYTLCEAMFAHFFNGQEVIAPIVIINLMHPDSATATDSTTASVVMNKEGKSFVGYIEDALCNIDSLAVTADGVEFAEGELTYAYDGDLVKIVIVKEGYTGGTVNATYKQIKFSADDVLATNFQKAADAVDYVEMKLGMIPTEIIAPAFSEKPEFHDIMIQKCIDKAAYKWNITAVVDIPATAEVATREAAIQWKKDNHYTNKLEKVCYPMAGYENKILHLSTITAAKMQAVDIANDDVPSESPSNEIIFIDRVCLADGKTVYWLEYEVNELNAAGITSVNLVKQTLRLWGPHMGNFNQATISNIKPEHKFDTQIRMLGYILNYLQMNYYDEIDETFSPKDVDSVKNSIQTWLDSLVNDGKLLYAEVDFASENNPVEQLENGDLIFDIKVTYGIVAKSITFRVQYNRTGLSLLFEGGDE